MQTWNLILRKKKRASNQVKHRIKTLIAGLNASYGQVTSTKLYDRRNKE